ncbi:DUF4440 domain-containing protein [Dactylosporangium sp. NBC_01737]|uniref:DUF4440 domain-containing protein n=1 Tax=Dactylosporangium sp. NBC_01737 TaxID=2975959 RepID=UPI002E0F8748|nr:DUF4440 domain-containing protein [Dactylosporangium sp. NBC_01737]
METLLHDFFRAVSFEPGERPHYDAIRDLFVPEGLLVKAVGAPDVATVDAFIAPRLALVESGALTRFHESELSGETTAFGNVAQRWSVYDKRGVQDGVAFAAVGRISTQFVRTPSGWRITSMAWDDER